jgi:hypothetical protein
LSGEFFGKRELEDPSFRYAELHYRSVLNQMLPAGGEDGSEPENVGIAEAEPALVA